MMMNAKNIAFKHHHYNHIKSQFLENGSSFPTLTKFHKTTFIHSDGEVKLLAHGKLMKMNESQQ